MEKELIFETVKATLLLALYISPFLFAVYYILRRYGKRQLENEQQFEKLYNEADKALNESKDFDVIQDHILGLYGLKWRDEEKMSALVNNFNREYLKKSNNEKRA